MIDADDVFLRDLRLEEVSRFLAQTGWRRASHPNGRILVFRGDLADDDGKSIDVVLPRTLRYVDAFDRLADAVNLLSEIDGVEPLDVVRRIKAVEKDVLNNRVPEKYTSGASISLQLATRALQGLRDLLGFAACSEQEPRPYFAKATAVARRHAERCRFGHTFHGSFGLAVESPVIPVKEPSLPETAPAAPFERRVMERVLRGFVAARESILNGDVTPLASGYATGFNANMCDAVLTMAKDGPPVGFEFSVAWSPSLKPPPDVRDVGRVSIDPLSFQYFEAAARQMRAVEQTSNVRVAGLIVQLSSKDVPSSEFAVSERLIAIRWAARGYRVQVPLSAAEYQRACDAHRDGRTVSTAGTIEKRGKYWFLTAAHDFRVEA